MYVKIRKVDELCTELVRPLPAVKAMLADLGVTVIDGYYDHARYESALAEPGWLRGKRKEWTLSHSTGLGAVKYVLDPLKISIVSHDMRGVNQYLTLQTPKRTRHLCKLLYRNSWMPVKSKKVAAFNVKGFCHDHAPLDYLFVCIEGPLAWHLKRDEMRLQWRTLSKEPAKYVQGLQCSWGDRQLSHGGLHLWLDKDSPHLLTTADALTKNG
jgi:hypothetical protein